MRKSEEEFKEIEGYEGYYYIGNNGTVKALDRFVQDKNGVSYNYKGGIKSQTLNRKGYQTVRLSKKCKQKTYSTHRLVAKHFVDGDNSLQVNHIDGNKLNNHYSNLEWVSCKENIRHSWVLGLHDITKRCRKVVISKNGIKQLWFDSVSECADAFGVNNGRISEYCKNKRNHTGGFEFEYYKESV